MCLLFTRRNIVWQCDGCASNVVRYARVFGFMGEGGGEVGAEDTSGGEGEEAAGEDGGLVAGGDAEVVRDILMLGQVVCFEEMDVCVFVGYGRVGG